MNRNDEMNFSKMVSMVPEYPHELVGHTEALNSQNDLEFQPDEPLLIGEYEKALLVHNTGSKIRGLEYRRAGDVVAETVLTLVSNKEGARNREVDSKDNEIVGC